MQMQIVCKKKTRQADKCAIELTSTYLLIELQMLLN